MTDPREDALLVACPNPWCFAVSEWGVDGGPTFYYNGSGQWRIDCSCGVSGPWSDTKAEAVAAWNHRASPPPSLAVGEQAQGRRWRFWTKRDPANIGDGQGGQVIIAFRNEDERLQIYDALASPAQPEQGEVEQLRLAAQFSLDVLQAVSGSAAKEARSRLDDALDHACGANVIELDKAEARQIANAIRSMAGDRTRLLADRKELSERNAALEYVAQESAALGSDEGAGG